MRTMRQVSTSIGGAAGHPGGSNSKGKTRIPPVALEALPEDLREVLEQRKRYGAPLYRYLLYARNPSYFRAAQMMWATIQEATQRVPGTAQGAALPPGCFLERLPVLNGLQRCRVQQTWLPTKKIDALDEYANSPLFHRSGEGSARIR